MDNITHSLIGLAAGEAVCLSRRKSSGKIWLASLLANSLPDSDVLITSTLFPDKVGYLLHHRGHTHTLLTAPLQSLVLLAILRLFWREKNVPWREIAFVTFLGPVLHLFADFWNSYGVHPFWPWNSEWFYGDMIFIVEPWIWVLLLPYFVLRSQSKMAKFLLSIPVAVILGLVWYHPIMIWPIALALTLSMVLFFVFHAKVQNREKGFLVSASLVLLLLLGFGISSNHLLEKYQRPNAETMVQPYPANPFCWLSIQAWKDDTHYRAIVSDIALLPALLPVEMCRTFYPGNTTAALQAVTEAANPSQKFLGKFEAPLEEMRVVSSHCEGRELFRFLRFPFWKRDGQGWILGDLRYDREEGLGFSEIRLEENAPCRSLGVPWKGKFFPES